jgi:hypothetical protein
MAIPHSRLQSAGLSFPCVGAAFVAIAASGQPAFLGVGVVFVVLGTVFLARRRKGGGA